MGNIVETISLECGCQRCGKMWESHEEMVKDQHVECDFDYDQMIYFHRCKKDE
ncbi:hypothetical protein IMZ31_20195 (plasmid) [Pontibacillus sp. ALD_SL1]|uniref:hypothetical protein n=1 Tax=Pontibacillus sp. ALD_SL1 TaxID=2777185 RepID=UPI001A95BED0|nr:hypothetical protein [Pontibacillus sp. ALD_SL1]QST02873.1 hypothetical protein IMZ31_20195 [Pontibacillus sp. ALD_SL1]